MHGAALVRRMALVAAAAAALAACASAPPPPLAGAGPGRGVGGTRIGPPYQVGGIWYVPREQPDYDQVGTASWYGRGFDGRATADGELFNMNAVSGAHTTLPLPSIVEVTNLANGRRLQVRVNDRGPFVGDRIIDLSYEAARQLGYERQGLARVRVRYVGPAPLLGPEAGVRVARARPAPSSAAVRTASAAPARPPPDGAEPAAPDGVALTSTAAAPRGLQILPAMPAKPGLGLVDAVYSVQVGAFSDEGRARRAAARLSGLGETRVETTRRGAATLYRVVLSSPGDAVEAYALRERVAAAGFDDAVVTGPF